MRQLLAALLLLLAAPAAAQDTDPLWEIRLGGFGLFTPDYPASSQYSLNGLGGPFVLYRGDVFRLGGDAAAQIVPIENRRFRLGLSFDGSFPANSEDNDARTGMPDLGFLGEAGPELVLLGPSTASSNLDFALQGRGVFSLHPEDGLGFEGFVVEPAIRYQHRDILGKGSRLRASVGAIFATEALHDYFYEVAPAFAAPGRPAFDAEAGYLGTEANIGLSVPLSERFRVFGGLGLGLYEGAANANSPLFENTVNGYAYFGASLLLFKSQKRVPR